MSAIVDKIRKLLEMSKRGTEHEASVAAARVAELMAKHDIEAADLELPASQAPTVETGRIDDGADEDRYATRYQGWKSVLAETCARSCGARSYQERCNADKDLHKFTVVGPPGSVAAARYLYTWLMKEVRRVSTQERNARQETDTWRTSFRVAMVNRLHERMQTMRRQTFAAATSQAMVRVDAVQVAVQAAYDAMDLKDGRAVKARDYDGYVAGHRAADRVKLGEAAGHIGEGQRRLKS